MRKSNPFIASLWEGLLLAWASRVCWGYRSLVYAPVFLVGVAAIAAAGFLAHLTGFIAAALVAALCAGTLALLVYNGVLTVSLLASADVEHGLVLAELSRKHEVPDGPGQLLWARQRAAAADAAPVWVLLRLRRTMQAIHKRIYDVGDAFPAFAPDRAPSWARWLLARCTSPMAGALAARAFADGPGSSASRARESLLLYTAVWRDAFRWNLALWGAGWMFMMGTVALTALPLIWATAASVPAVQASAALLALWTGFALQRVVMRPILEAAALSLLDEMAQGSSTPPDAEPRLREVSAAFRELENRTREATEMENGPSF